MATREAGVSVTIPHRAKRWVETTGYGFACSCGVRTIKSTRALRDKAADGHLQTVEVIADKIVAAIV
jgi:hypothetical protein